MNDNAILRSLRTSMAARGSGTPRKTGNKWLDYASSGMYLVNNVRDIYKDFNEHYRKHTTWTITVEESDALYRGVQRWLLSELPETDARFITASSQTFYVEKGGDAEEQDELSRLLDSSAGVKDGYSETRIITNLNNAVEVGINVGGHNIKVTISTAGAEDVDDPRRAVRRPYSSKMKGNGKIIFNCRSAESQQAVINHLESMVVGKNKRKPALWIADSWGDWRAQDAPTRRLSSVVLQEGIKEDLLADIRKFLADEGRYGELGIPWHRGLLLHGPAGTGKTSLIKALTAELGLDLWYAPLGDIKEDSGLLGLVRSVRPRGVLLLEDVDSYAVARDTEGEKDEEGKGLSTSALLQALDGVVTPHGLITIMTTNHIDKLDHRLIRSGRVDRSVELGLPGWSEVQALWSLFFPKELPLDDEPDYFATLNLSQANVSEIFKRWWDEPVIARKVLMEKVSENSGSSA